MELLHIATARSIWLFNPNDLNPRGGAFALDWVQRFVERYSFSTAPTLASLVEASIKNEASQFTNGRFTTSAGIEVAVTLQLYNDGLIAQACQIQTETLPKFWRLRQIIGDMMAGH